MIRPRFRGHHAVRLTSIRFHLSFLLRTQDAVQ
ncbi:MAG: hypothetical protein JWN70_2862 [Planctomycetaceae bacterium]|nr:hypothetical protein [Planctomycetaceae bacterium]